MTARISHTSVDSHDAYAQSAWWGQVLDWSGDPEDTNEPGHEECMIFSADGRQRLLFNEVPKAKTVKNRLHSTCARTGPATPRSRLLASQAIW